MGKTSKWIKNFLTGKKEKGSINNQSILFGAENPTTPNFFPPTTPKEKRRWSFRRSSATATSQKDLISMDNGAAAVPPVQAALESENEQKKQAMAVAMATAAAADAAVAAAQAAAAMMRLTSTAPMRASSAEEAAATKIQSVFRSYLARKALYALKGLVKLQALVRGHLVRKQATATLRCMQALVTVQARARAQRIRMVDEANPYNQRPSNYIKSTPDDRFRYPHHDQMEENIKIVEMDHGDSKESTKSRSSYSNQTQTEQTDHRFSTHRHFSKQEYQQNSPAPSAVTDMSPRTYSGHFEEYSFAQTSPQCYSAISKPDPSRAPFSYSREYAESLSYEYPFFPNYMANTESSKAKVRSHSAPKQRPADTFERQTSRRRPSIEGRNVPRAVRMRRSSSHVGATAQNYQYQWSIKLDKSAVSLKESECGSNSTMPTNTNYCRSLVGFDVQGQ